MLKGRDAKRFISHGEMARPERSACVKARSLVQAERRAASDGLRQVGQRIGFALLEFGVARGSFKALLPNGVMANPEHLPCLAISTAFSGRLRHA
jgi:hypothetical protein